MATKNPDEKNRLTIDLPEDLAKRLMLAATTRKRPASDVVAELLDRYLPHLAVHEKKKKIPYT